MVNPFDNNANPFDRGTGGNPQRNRRKGKVGEEEAKNVIRHYYGEPQRVPDREGGRDFDVYDPVSGRKTHEIEVKTGNAQLSGVQEDRRETLPNGVEYVVLCFGNPPWY
ncbi:hypothetical protein EGH25_01730 [Haladaptatus sp. F3-133]|uniref:Uncharacterized protein n=1 Tax=Halorutilus salinus TaxID=2487751 RepID=A0A9Q4GFE6_9EURY|nr:hypothetical protein [Halorutilus salinus]MCX2818074.1 hypothetical protein [Halorutilus salinus]